MAKKLYLVLIPCRSTKTKKRYDVGDKIQEGDFTKAVIANWLACNPPVLEEVVQSGSNPKR